MYLPFPTNSPSDVKQNYNYDGVWISDLNYQIKIIIILISK